MVGTVSVILEKMIGYFGQDVRRVNHALKVYGFARAIGGSGAISADRLEVLELAAILHDIGIKEAERKYSSTAGRYQELEGPPIARDIMAGEGVDGAVIDRVCHLVGNHHSYGKIDGPDFQILVEADFLVNIFEDGMEQASIKSIREKYFRTPAGIKLLEGLYGGAGPDLA